MQRNRNGHQRRKNRARILRTQTMCAWCGKPVDKTLPPDHPMAAQVDHKTAIANGGAEYDLANLQLMHRECNRDKWHRDLPVDLHTSRPWW